MGYYVRSFCTASEPPAINIVIRSLRDRDLDVRAETDDPAELELVDWTSFALIYKAGKQPIVVECNRDKGYESLARVECREFEEFLEDLEDSPTKHQVAEHLKNTRFIICCQLVSDIDDDGFEANGEFLNYFVDNCGGMIQADGEGFYDGVEIILPLE